MLDLLSTQRCRYRFLSGYFGRDLGKNCGHCSWCISKESVDVKIPPPSAVNLPECEPAFQQCISKGMRDPLAMAKFAYGMTSPALTGLKLYASNPQFGILEGKGCSFRDVVKLATEFMKKVPPIPRLDISRLQKESLPKLKEFATQRGLPVSGKKDDLIARLKLFQEKK